MQAAEIFHAHPEYFDWEAQRFILADKSRTALEFEQVRYVSSVQDSKELVEGARQVEVLGKTYPVKAEVARLEGLSAHAGQDFLLEYALAVKEQVKQVFLVHGEQQEGGIEKV